MARIGIIGCEGAMGHALAAVIGASGHELAGGIDKGGDAAGLADASEVLVDFSTPGALCINLHAAIGAGVPLIQKIIDSTSSGAARRNWLKSSPPITAGHSIPRASPNRSRKAAARAFVKSGSLKVDGV